MSSHSLTTLHLMCHDYPESHNALPLRAGLTPGRFRCYAADFPIRRLSFGQFAILAFLMAQVPLIVNPLYIPCTPTAYPLHTRTPARSGE